MSIIFYCLGYVAVITFVAVALMKITGYMKKPQHLRWELYPVPHEAPERAKYGGSYLEEVGWWQKKHKSCQIGALLFFLVEALTLKASWEHNRPLWVRTYPFHIGLYLLMGSLLLTVLSALCWNCEGWKSFFTVVTAICDVVGFAGVLFGSLGLIQRRLCDAGLRKYTTPEHFFNLGLFAVFSFLGLALCLWYGMIEFAQMGNNFIHGMFSFDEMNFVSPLYIIYLLIGFFMFFCIPFSFLGHFFMKFFTWHDIRWGDTPYAWYSDKKRQQLANNLNFPVSWRAPHVQGDGKKTWAEVATSDPEKQD